MAIFEPTPAEKEAASYLEWNDADLGKFCKYVALELEQMKEDAEGLHKLTAASCAMLLVGSCLDSKAGSLSLKLDEYVHAGEAEGSWVITVKRQTPKKAARPRRS